MSAKKKVLISLLSVIGALLLVVIVYAAYVFISYSRIEDNLVLEVEGTGTDSAVKVGESYTIVTQNLGFGAYTPEFSFFMDGGKQSRAVSRESVINCIETGAETIKKQDPDFVLFQEIDTDSTRSHHVDQAEMLKMDFEGFSSVFAFNWNSVYLFYPITEPHGASNSGIQTFSRFGITSSLRRSLPKSTSLSKIVDLDRCYSVSRVPVEGGGELVIYNVHLSAYGSSDEVRTGQMTMLFNDIKSEYDKGNWCVCGGDFNHDFTGNSTLILNGEQSDFGWAMPFPTEMMPEHIVRVSDYTCGEQKPTCRTCEVPYEEGIFTVIVDGFLVTDNVSVTYLENIQTGFAYSDHNPVVMKFELN